MLRLVISSCVGRGAVLLALLYAPLGFHQAWAEDDALSREAIMRQHQNLSQHAGGEEVNSETSSLAPPMSASDTGSMPSGKQEAGSNLVVQLLDRVSALETQVRTMQGSIDQLTNKVQQDEATTEKKFSDMQFALQGNAGSSEASQTIAKNSEETSSSASVAVQNLRDGAAALKAKHYDEAERQARTALKETRSDWGRTEARFLLSQALAGQKSYQKAAVSYYDTYKQDPKSKRAPQALLGVSGVMLALNNKAAACEALQQLADKYPDRSARVKSSEKLFRARASCH